MENEQNSFVKIFEDWLSSQENKNTKKSYSRIIPQFFYLMFEKNMKDISSIELQKITPERVREKYIEYLREAEMKDTTIINYLNILSSFIIYLSKKNKYDLDYWNITRDSFSKEILDNEVEKVSVMTSADFNQLKHWFLEKKYAKRYGNLNERYSLVVELIWITSMRIDEAFSSFRWTDIYWEQDECGNIGWTIYLNDKASRAIKKPISDEFYNKLNNIFCDVDNLGNQLVLSGVSKQTFSRQLKEYSVQYNVNYTSESIRLGLESEIENDRTKTISLIESTNINNKQFDLLTKEDFVAILNKRVDLKKAVMIEFNK